MKATIANIFMLFVINLLSLPVFTQVTVNGHLYFGEDLQPLPAYEVLIFLPQHGQQYATSSDQDGYYELSFDWTSAELPDVLVEVVDLCTGRIQRHKLPNDDSSYTADFRLCQGIDPPPPPAGCRAFFSYEQLSVHPLTVVFFDLSYSDQAAIIYRWDFGDGTGSEGAAPTHEYEELGVYQVTLSIQAGDCESSITQTVIVSDMPDCICTAIYNPVCVTLDDGTIITFSNPCEAECAGFAEGDWASCTDNPCGCPEFYDPVCITVDDNTLTFPNRCFAECDGWPADQLYPCNPMNNCGCPDIYDPVCVRAADGQVLRFPNACLAECSGYRPNAFIDCEEPCYCPEYYDPVCVVENGVTRQFDNICFAQCEGYTEEDVFPCNPGHCDCPEIYEPVCLITDDGSILWFSNRCELECAGFDPEAAFPCRPDDCGCPEYYEPVCVVVDGVTHTFDNICFAKCAGYTEDQIFTCEPGNCNCPEIYDPVCLVTDEGPAYWFGNSCEAECAGFGPDVYESCDPEECVCPAIWDPVCIVTATGDLQQFDNYCMAICAGYSEEDLVPCDEDSCHCDDVYDPVCIYTPGGSVLRFPNPCVARCAGYREEHWISCDDTYCRVRFWAEHISDDQLVVQFYSHIDPSDDGQVHYEWNFGDGTTAEGPDPLHHFAKAGVYSVQLTITTTNGCVSTYEEEVVVGAEGPYQGECKAMFSFEQGDEPGTFHFRDRSLGQIVEWQWFFGDGNVSQERHPTHRYSQSGVYIVSLSVTSSDGCTALMSMLIAVDEDIVYNPVCSASFLPFFVPGTNQVYFLNFSSPDAVAYEWDFGDGTGATSQQPIHQYGGPGTYIVKLTIQTEEDCISTYSVTIDLAGQQFTAAPDYTFRTTDTKEPRLSASLLHLYPNPVNDVLWVEWKDMSAVGDTYWRVIGTDGRRWQQGRQEVIAVAAPWSINTSELPAGMYYLQLTNATGTVTKAFIRQ